MKHDELEQLGKVIEKAVYKAGLKVLWMALFYATCIGTGVVIGGKCG